MPPKSKEDKGQEPTKGSPSSIYTSGPTSSLPLEERRELARQAWRRVWAALNAGAATGWRRTPNTWHYPLEPMRGSGSTTYRVHVTIHWNDLKRDFHEAYLRRPRDEFEVLSEVFQNVLYHVTIEVNRPGWDNPHWYNLADNAGEHWSVPPRDARSAHAVREVRFGEFRLAWAQTLHAAAQAVNGVRVDRRGR